MILHSLAIHIYVFVLRLASLFNGKAKMFISSRKLNPIKKEDYSNGKKRVLFHCASLGEYEMANPFIRRFSEQYQEFEIVLSFFSSSGFQNVKKSDFIQHIVYLPFDTKNRVARFIKTVKPEIVFMVKNEFWPNLFRDLKKKNIPILSIYSSISSQQKYFSGLSGMFYKRIFNAIDHFYPSRKHTGELLKNHGYHNVSFIGDGRIEKAAKTKLVPFTDPIIESFSKNHFTICAGSSYQTEESFLAKLLHGAKEKHKLMIAPHHIDEPHIQQILNLFGDKAILHSNASADSVQNKQVIIIDSIGSLKYLYRYSDVALIGGGFRNGLHNVFEAIIYGIPVITGPKYQEDEHYEALKNQNCIFVFENVNDLRKIISQIQKVEKRKYASLINKYCDPHKSSSDKLMELIEKQGFI